MKKQKVRFHRNDKRPGGLNQNLIYDFANHFFPIVLNVIPSPIKRNKLLFLAEELEGFWSDIGAPVEYKSTQEAFSK